MPSPLQLKWLYSMAPMAKEASALYPVPPSVTLAQCTLESGWGTTQLARLALNFFGIKAEHLNDPNTYEEFPTAEYISGNRVIIEAKFEKYASVTDSFTDHARLLATANRYAPAMAVAKDPFAFAMQLQVCGYSTSPTYGVSLGQLITQLHLQEFD